MRNFLTVLILSCAAFTLWKVPPALLGRGWHKDWEGILFYLGPLETIFSVVLIVLVVWGTILAIKYVRGKFKPKEGE